jgi:hypothetical protein
MQTNSYRTILIGPILRFCRYQTLSATAEPPITLIIKTILENINTNLNQIGTIQIKFAPLRL